MKITLASRTLELLPQRAVLCHGTGTLFVADVHLGKATSFAAGGIPVAHGTAENTNQGDLDRMAGLVRSTGASGLTILGDLIHASTSRHASLWSQLYRWRESIGSIEVRLIQGNHDRASGALPAELQIRSEPDPSPGGELTLRHVPAAMPDGRPSLAGHVHPAVTLQHFRERVRVPAFWLLGKQLILPAFGSFTGTSRARPPATAAVYAVTHGGIVSVPPEMIRFNAR